MGGVEIEHTKGLVGHSDADALLHACLLYTSQMLSEFATKQIQEAIERRCWKEGYGVIQVNPAYTSQIGREKYSRKMGCTVHMAASFVIARRGMGYQN